MKNIILVDICGTYLASALATNNVKIKLMVADGKYIINLCEQKFPNSVERYYYRKPLTNDEFEEMNRTDYDLTYEDIEKYRSTQLKVEHFLHRELNDDTSIQYRYLTALRFFIDYFNKNKIDMVLAAHQEHGGTWDSVIFDVAKANNVPVYIITAGSLNDKQELNNITDFNNNDLCKIGPAQKSYTDSDKFFEKLKNYSISYKEPKNFLWQKIYQGLKDLFFGVGCILYKIRRVFFGYSKKEKRFWN